MRGFLAGALAGAVVTAVWMNGATPTMASVIRRQMDVDVGVKVVVNDRLLQMRDSTGRPVEAFSSDGAVYVPVRALADAFDVQVEWDQATRTAYLGRHIENVNAVALTALDSRSCEPAAVEEKWENAVKLFDNQQATRWNAIDMDASVRIRYPLDGSFKTLTGVLAVQDAAKGLASDASVVVRGDGRILWQSGLIMGVTAPMDVSVDMSGVRTLEIVFGTDSDTPLACLLDDLLLER